MKSSERFIFIIINNMLTKNLPYLFLFILIGAYLYNEMSSGCGRQVKIADEPTLITQAKTPCEKYDSIYGELNAEIDKTDNSNWFSKSEKLDKFKEFKRNLDSTYCSNVRDLSKVDSIIQLYDSIINEQRKQGQIDFLNGDDLTMEGVKITSCDVLTDAQFNNYVNIEISNETNKVLTSLRFGLYYWQTCDYPPPLFTCYKTLIKPIRIAANSRRVFNFSLPPNMPSEPSIVLLEIVRGDGTKKRTAYGFQFSTSGRWSP